MEIVESTTALSTAVLPDLSDILAGQLTASSIAMYKYSIKQYMAFASGNGLDQFNPKTLDAWRDYLAHETNKSPNTINRMLSAIRRLYKEAARRELVDENIALKFMRVPGVQKKALKTRLKHHSRTRISPEDMRRLCESPDTSTLVGKRDRALLATLATSGVRASELATLTVSQIVSKNGGYQLLVRGKTDVEYREAALSPEAKGLIDGWLASRPVASENVFTSFSGRGDSRATDKPLSESGVWKIVTRYAQICGLEHIKPHDFRRFVGTRLTATGDIRLAQKALGHRSIEVTARHYVLDELEVGITDNLY